MIKITGVAKLSVPFEVELNMSEEEFDDLTERQQNDLLDNHIDWMEVCRGGEVDDIDVYDLEEIEDVE